MLGLCSQMQLLRNNFFIFKTGFSAFLDGSRTANMASLLRILFDILCVLRFLLWLVGTKLFLALCKLWVLFSLILFGGLSLASCTCADQMSAEDSRGTLCRSLEYSTSLLLSSLVVCPINLSHLDLFKLCVSYSGRPLGSVWVPSPCTTVWKVSRQ